jgi:hypothetical protein
MAHRQDAPPAHLLEEAITTLLCIIDDTCYRSLNPQGRRQESLKKLSDSEVLTLALVQQLRGVESERSFLRDAQRLFSHLFPGVLGLLSSSLQRRVRKLRRLEWSPCGARYLRSSGGRSRDHDRRVDLA